MARLTNQARNEKFGSAVMASGILLLVVGGAVGVLLIVYPPATSPSAWSFLPEFGPATVLLFTLVGGVALILCGAWMAMGYVPKRVMLFKHIQVQVQEIQERQDKAKSRIDDRDQADQNVFSRILPDSMRQPREFNLFADTPDSAIFPIADPQTPMYILDECFRIREWNEAFALAFDNSMEGMRGITVLNWVYHLDNWKEVIRHGNEVFGEGKTPPGIDVEEIRYSGQIYGRLTATKRAYGVPSEKSAAHFAGWIVLLDVRFDDAERANQFFRDLITLQTYDQIWTQYSLFYDRFLLETEAYNHLMNLITGDDPDSEIAPIMDGALVLDLGAGTGNVGVHLCKTRSKCVVYAIEKNRSMFRLLRDKCVAEGVLRKHEHESGVVPVRQDIASLAGVPDESCDVVILNNVLYSVRDTAAVLSEVFRCLKRGGEVRISGPKQNSNLNKLFRNFRRDLEREISANGTSKFEQIVDEYRHVEEINKQWLKPMFMDWDVTELNAKLLKAGFETPYYCNPRAYYYGQGMLVCAKKLTTRANVVVSALPTRSTARSKVSP